MKNKPSSKKSITAIVIGIFVLIVIASFFIPKKTDSKKYDEFAQCLTDKGVKFYGTSWCKYCNAQKEEFGSAQKKLPFIECSTPDGKGQTQVCQDAKIEGYPTWEFPDGSRETGKLPLELIAEKSGCQLPQ